MLVDAAHTDWRGPIDNGRDVLVAPQLRVGAAEADHRSGIDAGDFPGISARQSRHFGVGRAPARRVVEDPPVRDFRIGGDDLVDLCEDLRRLEPVWRRTSTSKRHSDATMLTLSPPCTT